ncbi:hypothetical protein MMC29_000927 [Sticta canariensis]|nr:hypothetical protein [Sticta canariensis]
MTNAPCLLESVYCESSPCRRKDILIAVGAGQAACDACLGRPKGFSLLPGRSSGIVLLRYTKLWPNCREGSQDGHTANRSAAEGASCFAAISGPGAGTAPLSERRRADHQSSSVRRAKVVGTLYHRGSQTIMKRVRKNSGSHLGDQSGGASGRPTAHKARQARCTRA